MSRTPRRPAKKINRSSSNSFFLPVVIILLVIISFSGVTAFVWQQFWDKSSPQGMIYMPSKVDKNSSSGGSSSNDENSSSQSSSSANGSSSSSQATSSEENPPSTELFGVALPENERVRSEFFDSAVFIGDSITTGIELYGILPNTTVIASTGINLDNIITKKAIGAGDEKQTALEALAQKDPTSIYIMLGANGLANLSVEQTVDLYRVFAAKVRESKPNADIYIQSILPINEPKFWDQYSPNLTNKKIDECNIELMKMAGELKMYYVDVNSAVRDESGGLPSDFTTDGLHFKSEYYNKWIDYLKMHTAPK